MLTRKQQEASRRNWLIFQMAGIVAQLQLMATQGQNLTEQEANLAAQLSLDTARLLDLMRKGG